jgi:hypothetical protein
MPESPPPKALPSQSRPGLGMCEESKKGRHQAAGEGQEKTRSRKLFHAILRLTRASCGTSRPTVFSVSFSSRCTVATGDHATPCPCHLPLAGGQKWRLGVSRQPQLSLLQVHDLEGPGNRQCITQSRLLGQPKACFPCRPRG